MVTGPVRKTPFALRVPAEVRRFGSLALRERVLLELPVGRSPPQGAVLAFRARVDAPRGPEDGFDERGWLARRGVHVVLHGGDWQIVGRRGGIGGVSDRLRAHVARAIAPGLAGERRALLAGIVLGEDEGLSEDLRDSFKASGLYHLLAVSGQNITFLALGVIGLAWLLGVPRLAAEIVAIAAIVAYVLAVGWQPSVVRAGVAGGLASLAWLLSRPRDRWHFLALGAGVLLAWTPASLLEPGFQLSFAAVGSIFLLLPRLRLALEGYPLTGLAAGRPRRLGGVRRGDGPDPVAAVRERPGLLAARQRPRDACDRPAARARARRLTARAGAAVGGGRARLRQRLGGRVHRDVRPARGRVALRSDRFRSGRLRPARHSARAARPAAPAAPAPRRRCSPVRRRSCRLCSSGSSFPGGRCRRRPACGSRSSTSGRAMRSCCRCPRERCSSTRDRPRQTWRSSCADSASTVWPPSCSRTPSATTSAGRRPCSAVSPSTVSSTPAGRFEPVSPVCTCSCRRPRSRGRRDACRRRVQAGAASAACSLARQRRLAVRGSEPARRRPARELRRGRRAPHR